MAEPSKRSLPGVLAHWAPALLVVGLILFHGINNWIWLNKNAMTRGWDRIASLVNSLYYHKTLSELSLQALFKAATQDQIRPPLFALSMALMYGPFGVSPDVAVMVNVVYFAVLVGATYGAGAKLGGRRLGMLAAVLVAFSPLVFAMSRYSYFEFSVAALTMSSVYLLLASERFEKRGASLLLGVSLGLGLLTKRTFPVFVAGALVVVVLQAGLPRKFWSRLRVRPRFRWRDVGLAVGGGLLLSALWYLPNRELAQGLSVDPWIFPVWWLLAAVTIYLLRQSSSSVTNFLSCCALALSLASLWYLPHSDFLVRALRAGWGVNDPRGRTVNLASLSAYTEYLDSILYGLSPFFVALLILVLGLLLIHLVQRRRRPLPTPWWDWNWWVILASLASAYFVLSTSIYKEPRAITPALPLLGVILAGVLLALPWRRLRRALIALAITFGLVQFFAVSFTETHWLAEKTMFDKPILGMPGLFAQGPYLELPDSGYNDPGFYIAGDVLQWVEAARQSQGWESISLGILAGSSHVHVGMFAYDQILRYPAIQLENPVLAHPEEPGYSRAFGYDYLLVLSKGSRGDEVRETADLILGERRSWFEQAFELDQVYPLPDGSEVSLFRRRARPPGAYDAESLQGWAEYLVQRATVDDLVIVHPPGLVSVLLARYWGPAPVAIATDQETLAVELAAALEQHSRLFLATDQDTGTALLSAEQSGLDGFVTEDRQFGELRVLVLEPATP